MQNIMYKFRFGILKIALVNKKISERNLCVGIQTEPAFFPELRLKIRNNSTVPFGTGSNLLNAVLGSDQRAPRLLKKHKVNSKSRDKGVIAREGRGFKIRM